MHCSIEQRQSRVANTRNLFLLTVYILFAGNQMFLLTCVLHNANNNLSAKLWMAVTGASIKLRGFNTSHSKKKSLAVNKKFADCKLKKCIGLEALMLTSLPAPCTVLPLPPSGNVTSFFSAWGDDGGKSGVLTSEEQGGGLG